MSKVFTEINSQVNELYAKTLVSQKFTNDTENPLELRIYIFKKDGIIFSSFNCKIGDSIKVESKIIKKAKAQTKYSDAIASGNAAIFVSEDSFDENRIKINMGNIPPKTDVIFNSEFIQAIEASQKYEFEFFRNLPIFNGKNCIYENESLKGKINVKTKNEIINLEKQILMKDLAIIEEKYQNDKKTDYLIDYKIKELPKFKMNNLEYIPSSKIKFDLNINKPFAYVQKSLDSKEKNYFIQYRYKNTNKDNFNKPALFIFLIDESGSMSGKSIKITKEALKIFIQSLPPGSYFQLIAFGSNFIKLDEVPKEYNKENINKCLSVIEEIGAKLGGTNLYKPLKEIYNSGKVYDGINLPKNIFILTDGEVENKREVLSLIETISNQYSIFSIGIGNSFDEDLIKNAGILGKGNYNFCKDLNNLNSIIAKEIDFSSFDFISNLEIKTNLNDLNLIKNNSVRKIIRQNGIVNLYYIIENKNDDEQIKMNVKYLDSENKVFEQKYEILPEQIEKGTELSKLIVHNYLFGKENNLTDDEKLNYSLKYQLLSEDTSLFAKVDLSETITEEMKLKIIDNKENKLEYYDVSIENNNIYNTPYVNINNEDIICENYCPNKDILSGRFDDENDDECYYAELDDIDLDDIRDECYVVNNDNRHYDRNNNDDEDDEDLREKWKYNFKENKGSKINIRDNKNNKKDEETTKKFDLNSKENIMKMIFTQDFIEGFWEENEYTKIMKDKYRKQYDFLMGLKNKVINDRIVMTILVIYYINKECPELLNDLLMILKKAKNFIKKESKDSYENFIKEINFI